MCGRRTRGRVEGGQEPVCPAAWSDEGSGGRVVGRKARGRAPGGGRVWFGAVGFAGGGFCVDRRRERRRRRDRGRGEGEGPTTEAYNIDRASVGKGTDRKLTEIIHVVGHGPSRTSRGGLIVAFLCAFRAEDGMGAPRPCLSPTTSACLVPFTPSVLT